MSVDKKKQLFIVSNFQKDIQLVKFFIVTRPGEKELLFKERCVQLSG